jgi:hypothetical protein
MKLLIKIGSLGNSAQLATNLIKFDDNQSIPINIITELMDHDGETDLFNIKDNFNIKPIKELYISDWVQEKQEGLLRLARINKFKT